MLRDLQACLGLKDHLDLRELVGTQVLREIMGPSVLQEHQDHLANFPFFHLIFSSSAMHLSRQAGPREKFGETTETAQVSRGHSRTVTWT